MNVRQKMSLYQRHKLAVIAQKYGKSRKVEDQIGKDEKVKRSSPVWSEWRQDTPEKPPSAPLSVPLPHRERQKIFTGDAYRIRGLTIMMEKLNLSTKDEGPKRSQAVKRRAVDDDAVSELDKKVTILSLRDEDDARAVKKAPGIGLKSELDKKTISNEDVAVKNSGKDKSANKKAQLEKLRKSKVEHKSLEDMIQDMLTQQRKEVERKERQVKIKKARFKAQQKNRNLSQPKPKPLIAPARFVYAQNSKRSDKPQTKSQPKPVIAPARMKTSQNSSPTEKAQKSRLVEVYRSVSNDSPKTVGQASEPTSQTLLMTIVSRQQKKRFTPYKNGTKERRGKQRQVRFAPVLTPQ